MPSSRSLQTLERVLRVDSVGTATPHPVYRPLGLCQVPFDLLDQAFGLFQPAVRALPIHGQTIAKQHFSEKTAPANGTQAGTSECLCKWPGKAIARGNLYERPQQPAISASCAVRAREGRYFGLRATVLALGVTLRHPFFECSVSLSEAGTKSVGK